MTENDSRATPEPPTTLKIILLLEFMALLIGLAMPVTPSKTGSDASLAEWFIDEPGYLQEVFVYFVMTNVLLGLLILAAWVWHTVQKPEANVQEQTEDDSGSDSPEEDKR